MRLIDADLLKQCYTGKNSLGTNDNDSKADYASIRKMIDSQPTAYDADKVVERLADMIQPDEDYQTGEHCENWVVDMQNEIIGQCINIVRKGAVKE